MFFVEFQGFLYAGLQNSNQCFCGNSYGEHGAAPIEDCKSECKGNSEQICGGSWRNSIYSVGKYKDN